MQRDLPRISPRLRRGAAVVVLCAITAIGLRAASGAASGVNSWAARIGGSALYDIFGIALGIALVASMVTFGLMMRLRRLKRKRDRSAPNSSAVPWWARLLLLLFLVLILGGPVGLLTRDLLHKHPRQQAPLLRPGLGFGRAAPVTHTSGGLWPVVTGMILGFVALVIIVIVMRRRRKADLRSAESTEPDDETVLLDALAAGADAMRNVPDPREAIIACYAAMEQQLARAGAAPSAADTPAEILDRAAAGGLVRSTAASELTELFREARYGRRAMAESERAAAQSALARLRSDLATAQAEAAAAQAEAAARAEAAASAPAKATR